MMEYEGEIDNSGKACGIGKALFQSTDTEVDERTRTEQLGLRDRKHTFEGTWFENHPHGICKSLMNIL